MESSTSIRNSFAYRYEALFNSASIGIVIVDGRGTMQSVNPLALKLFGYSEAELPGKPITLLIPGLDDGQHGIFRNVYSSKPRIRQGRQGLNLRARKKNGTEFPVEISFGYFNGNGDKQVFAFIHDISIRRKAQAEIINLHDEQEVIVEQRTLKLTEALHQLQQSKEELSKSLEKEKDLSELKSRFLSMASHEFRTPLSTVLSSSYLISKYTSTEDQHKRQIHLDRIISSVHMLTDILNDFLCVGKIEEGKIPVRFSEFDIHELMKSVAEEMKTTLKKEQQIHCNHRGCKMVFMDASVLKHIIMNLVSNASKFSHEGGLIEIRSSCNKNSITLSVKDYGIGISREDQQHLMERFFRGANAANIQGTGLGLHIVSRYAELLNGKVKCVSELEKGTEFILTFKPKIAQYEKDPADRGQ